MKPTYAYLVLILLLVGSCRKDFEGDAVTTDAPETYMIVDSVKRDTVHFLITTVKAYWWGSAPKGFIKGYEVSTDNMQSWKFTTDQSGTFLLNLPLGVKKGEFPVYVRAIDNRGTVDPTPARMVFPIENSIPRVGLDASLPMPDNSFPVIKMNWIASDIDGLGDLDHYDLVWNDTSNGLFALPGTVMDAAISDTSASVSVRIEGQRNNGVFISGCLVYTGSKITPQPGVMDGLLYNAKNTLFIRAVDKTGNTSAWVKDSLFVKRPASDIVLVNALYANSALIQNFYTGRLAGSMVDRDSLEILRGVNSLSGNSELYADALTQKRTFNLFKHILWLTDDPNTLNTAQLTTADFFNQGGTMFIYAQFGDDFPVNAQVLSFTPAQKLVDPASNPTIINGRFRMDNSSSALPVLSGWPALQFNGPITAARPFITNPTSSGIYQYDSLMYAVLRVQTSTGSPVWDGPSTMMSRRVRISAGKADMILSTLPLQYLNGNNNIDSLFKHVFIDELAF
ncbi:MAG: hypothetical protein WC760_10795 [Bacteroidia bacterium]|jgi:hypothetical protein